MKLSYRTVLFFLLFILPIGAVTVYELRYATDRYHSDGIVTITQGNSATPALDLSIIGLPAGVIILLFGGFMMFIGFMFIRKIVDIEV